MGIKILVRQVLLMQAEYGTCYWMSGLIGEQLIDWWTIDCHWWHQWQTSLMPSLLSRASSGRCYPAFLQGLGGSVSLFVLNLLESNSFLVKEELELQWIQQADLGVRAIGSEQSSNAKKLLRGWLSAPFRGHLRGHLWGGPVLKSPSRVFRHQRACSGMASTFKEVWPTI